MGIRKLRLFVTNFDSCVQLISRKIDVVRSADIFYEKGKISTNFDGILMFDHEINPTLQVIIQNHSIPIMGIRRYTKLEQNIILKASDIKCPDTYDCMIGVKRKGLEIIDTMLHHISNDDYIILKPYLGAKGIGQIMMRKGEIYDKLYKIMEGDKQTVDEAKKDNDNNKEHKNYMQEQINGGSYCIQIFERNIEKEYRILYFFGNEPIIMERLKGKSWQSNMGAKPDNKVKYIGNEIQELLGSKNAKTVDELFNNLHTPFLSIDVYVNRDGERGIMEFQMEFGYDENYPANLIYKYINSSVNRMYHDKKG